MKNKVITILNQKIINNIDLNVEQFGYEKTSAAKVKETNSHNDFVITFILNGNLFFTKDGVKTKLGKSDCFIFSPFHNLCSEIDKTNPPTILWITICGRECNNVLKLTDFNMEKLYEHIPTKHFNKIAKMLITIFENYENNKDIPNYFEFNSCFYKILGIINKSIKLNSKNVNRNKANNHIEKALIYFSNHYTESDFSIVKVANAIGLHKNYLGKLFKEDTGLSFNEYLTNRRMTLAVYLIQQGYTSISEISRKVGIEDQFYFSKKFKNYNKITPSENIKKYQKLIKKR